MTGVGRWLAHPLTRDLHPDDPATTKARRQIVASKPFLRRIYAEWYGKLIARLPSLEGEVLELGSGAGFFRELLPEVITSEVFYCEAIQSVIDARKLPFRDGALRAIVMTDVMHHIPDIEAFLGEAQRTLRSGGRLLMVEPWVSTWSTFIYKRFHSEPFLPEASAWSFPATGPLSGANGALPWIVFDRDMEIFRRRYPTLQLVGIERFMPFRYLLSGGISTRVSMPGWSFVAWRALEGLLAPVQRHIAMFALIEIERR
jgi:SAM-dependent methyltransferase